MERVYLGSDSHGGGYPRLRNSHGAIFPYRRHLAGKQQKPIESALGHGAIEYNWDNQLRSASKGSDSIAVKYDPMGNRVYKSSTVDGVTAGQKFIVDISGQLPTILSSRRKLLSRK